MRSLPGSITRRLMSSGGRVVLATTALMLALTALTSSGYAQSESVIYNFDCYHAPENGCLPNGGVIEKDGVLFGVNTSGIYALKPPATPGGQWSETVLNGFPKGSNRSVTPGFTGASSLLAGANHTLYGTTEGGGTHSAGTVYSLASPANGGTPWVETTLYNFGGASHVLSPTGALIADASGTLYGVALQGDAPCPMPPLYENLCGGVFSLSPPSTPSGAWTERRLYSFSNVGTDGVFPNGPLLLGTNGVLFGTTIYGGVASKERGCPQGCGVVFALTPPAVPGGAWTEQVLHSFTGSPDGGFPLGSLVADKSGRLFGTCSIGGATPDGLPPGWGTVFELSPPASPGGSWTEHTIWAFGITPTDGQTPAFGLAQGNGVFYGTTGGGNSWNPVAIETVFQLTPPAALGNPWTETILHTFPSSPTDAGYPSSGVLLGPGGVLYGTTLYGGTGAYGDGTVYEVTP